MILIFLVAHTPRKHDETLLTARQRRRCVPYTTALLTLLVGRGAWSGCGDIFGSVRIEFPAGLQKFMGSGQILWLEILTLPCMDSILPGRIAVLRWHIFFLSGEDLRAFISTCVTKCESLYTLRYNDSMVFVGAGRGSCCALIFACSLCTLQVYSSGPMIDFLGFLHHFSAPFATNGIGLGPIDFRC